MTKERLKYWWTIFYLPLYMVFFLLAEQMFVEDVHIIHMPLDDKIPFCEWFIFPYYVWFAYIAIFFIRIFFTDKQEYARFAGFLFSGMTVFLIISFVYPNGLELRPAELPRDNVATALVEMLYRGDTSTNVFPSIHVYNTLGVMISVAKNKKIVPNRLLTWLVEILGVLIILSTVFLKQHSVWDVLGAFAFGAIFYVIFYCLPARSKNVSSCV